MKKILLFCAALGLAAFTFRPQQGPDLSGHWVLNRTASDTLAKLRTPRTAGPRRQRAQGGKGNEPGISAEFPMGDPDAGDISTTAESMRNIIEATYDWNMGNEALTVTNSDSGGIRIAFDDSTVLMLRGDGATRKFPFRRFESLQAKSQWKDGKLVASYKSRGVSIQETYERGIDSPRMIVTTTIPSPMRQLSYRRVYDLRPTP
jgi:hypothetical protein